MFFFLSGCKKNTAVNGLIASYNSSVTANGTTTTSTITYTYDSQNRLIERQVTGTSNVAPITYSYSSGQVTATQGATVTIFQLNSQGLAISDNQGDVASYDNNGYQTAFTNTGQGTSTVNTISNGNIVSSTQTTNGVTNTYTYTFLSQTDYRSNGVTFLGKSNVNVVNTETISSPAASVYTFSYTYDSKGRVQTQTIVSNGFNQVDTYTYVNP